MFRRKVNWVSFIFAFVSVLGVTSAVSDQHNSQPIWIGQAYELDGFAKYLSLPSKILFANREFLDSRIIDAYAGDEFFDAQCNLGNEIILHRDEEVPWWSGPIYRYDIAQSTDQRVSIDPQDVVILPSDGTHCSGVDLREFVIDRSIQRILDSRAQ